MPYNVTGGQTYLLAASIGSSDTTILLSSFTEPVSGTPYTMAMINSDVCYATIAPKTANSEFISFTGIMQNVGGTATLTGVTRGLSRSYPFTSSATYKLAHSAQTQLILSNSPQQINEYVTIRNNETISGVKTFSAFPVTPSSAPSTNYQVANKKYVDDTTLVGVPDASTTVKGGVEEATQAEVDAKTAAGAVCRLFVNPSSVRASNVNDYVASDTGIADAYAIATNPVITAYQAGQVFIFRAGHANTGASTLNVCTLGTVSIVKNHDVALVANDIEAGQIIVVASDGTVMQMISQNGHDPATLYQILADLDTTTTLGTSNTKYPSQLAVKTYVDTQDTALGTAYFNGVGSATVNKTYHNFDIPSDTTYTKVGFSTTAGSGAYMIPDVNSANPQTILSPTIYPGAAFNTGKDVIAEFNLGFDGSNFETAFGLSNVDEAFYDYDDQTADALTFAWSGTKLYAHASNAGVGHTESAEITGTTLTALNTYRIEFNPGVDAKFYINGVLKATITTNLPDGANAIKFGYGSTGNQAVVITTPYFALEK